MNAFSRRGACPALSAPMQTGDGLLVRLNPVAGGVAPKTLIGLGESALRHGNGVMEVTARGSLQIRGLTPESAPLLAAEVDALGIRVRTGVPIETGPLAGLDPEETVNPLLLAERIRQQIDQAGLSQRLGPKVSVIVDGGGKLTMDTIQADIRLVAVGANTWSLSIAGDAATAQPIGLIEESAACDAVLTLLEAIAKRGREARARDLDAKNSGELPKLAGENEPVGIHDIGNNINTLGIGLPFGSMPAEKIVAMALAAEQAGASEIRFAPQRAILIMGLSGSTCLDLAKQLESLGFITDAADSRRRIAACPGAPACASGHLATREIAEQIAAQSADFLDPSRSLHISGCAKGCAHPAEAELTLVGGEKGAGLVVLGTSKGLPAAYMPGYEVARGVGRMARLLRDERRAGESAASCLSRLGRIRLAAAFQQG